jgi:hypothetical protein
MIEYRYLILAFMELCADKHGATFADENIETLLIDGEPATKTLIKQIETLAKKLADEAALTAS